MMEEGLFCCMIRGMGTLFSQEEEINSSLINNKEKCE